MPGNTSLPSGVLPMRIFITSVARRMVHTMVAVRKDREFAGSVGQNPASY
jgi:hypothetical protein